MLVEDDWSLKYGLPFAIQIIRTANGNESYSDGWKVYNPNNDRMNPQPLQRAGNPNATAYGQLPNRVEVEITI